MCKVAKLLIVGLIWALVGSYTCNAFVTVTSYPDKPVERDDVVEIRRTPELSRLSTAELKFTRRLYQALKYVNEPNLIFSPLVLHLALSALKFATGGDTFREIRRATSTSKLNDTFLQDGYKELTELLKTDEHSVLKLVNHFFVTKRFKIDGKYARLLRKCFSGDIRAVDFNNTVKATKLINSMVNNNTNGTITNAIEKDLLEATNRVVHLNSLYFQGKWQREFTPLLTRKETFVAEDGTEVKVDMMNRGGYYPYAEIMELNSTALSIPYEGNRFSFNVILPVNGIPISQLEKNLESYPIQAVMSKMMKRYIQLSIPKFSVKSTIDMVGPLQLLGVKTLLSTNANLTKMSRIYGLYVNAMQQKASFSISEGGTDVASSSFIEAVPATPRYLLPFNVDRPFIYFVYDNLTKTILFVGKKFT